jgi:hypothetical protein
MRQYKIFIGLFLCSFLEACAPVITQTQQYNPQLDFIGTYEGKVVSGIGQIPVKTVFVGDKNGLKSGSYVMTEEGGKQVPGTLDEFKQEGPYTYLASWHDKYGKGKLRMLFSDGGYVFKGFWGSTSIDEALALKWPTQTVSAWDGYKEHEK